MRNFIEETIKKAAADVGILHVEEKTSTPSNLIMPKPRIDYEFMPDSIIPSGRALSMRRDGDTRITVYERYEVDTPVMLYITASDDSRLSSMSDALIMAFPKGVKDALNNYVQIRASLAEWSRSKASKVGIKKIEPLKERMRTIRIGFMWRLTYEKAVPYITQVIIEPKLK